MIIFDWNSSICLNQVLYIHLIAAYDPPFHGIPPVYKEYLTPTKPTLICDKHNVTFTTKYFSDKANNQVNNKLTVSNPKDNKLEVCVALSMTINIPFPAEYTIVSPICFVSCKCSQSSFSLTLPHAVTVSSSFKKDSLRILSMITCDVRNFNIDSPKTEFPPDIKLEEISTNPEVFDKKLKFKADLRNPSLFAVGIKNDSARNIPRPLPVLRCTLFCMYDSYDEHSSISTIPVKMYVGMNIDSVREVCHCLPLYCCIIQ